MMEVKLICMSYIPSEEQLANVMNKGLGNRYLIVNNKLGNMTKLVEKS